MAHVKPSLREVDPVWQRICTEAETAIKAEPLIGGMMHACILHHNSFEGALAYRLSMKLASAEMSEQIVREIADAAYGEDEALCAAARFAQGFADYR